MNDYKIRWPGARVKHRMKGNQMGASLHRNNRPFRGFNPLNREDRRLFLAVMRGAHLLQGFRNKYLRGHLALPDKTEQDRIRSSAKISRLFTRLHIHGFIAKIPRSRKWRVTDKGRRLMTVAISINKPLDPDLILLSVSIPFSSAKSAVCYASCIEVAKKDSNTQWKRAWNW